MLSGGFGAAFVGAFASVAALATPAQREEVFAALYVVSYLAFGGSAVAAGLAVPSFGLRTTATVYGLVVIVLSLLAAAAGRRPLRISESVSLRLPASEPVTRTPVAERTLAGVSA